MTEEQPWRQQLKGVRAFVETLKEPTEQRDTATIAGKFAEALGCLEDAACWLGQVNETYDPDEHVSDIYLTTEYGSVPCNPARGDFWLQTDLAERALKNMLRRLQRVEPLAPKEKTR